MSKYKVTKEWIVEAGSAQDAIAASEAHGKQVAVYAEKFPTKTRMETLIQKYLVAAVEHSNIGMYDPSEHGRIKLKLNDAKRSFHTELDKLING